jgi:transcription elongation factor Elf1
MVKYKAFRKVKKKGYIKCDNRMKRSNQLLKYNCPSCTSKSLKEIKKQGYVWSNCQTCNLSGESNKIIDGSIIAACDVYYTIVDSFHDNN